MGSAKEIILKWVEAFNERDAQKASSLYALDAESTQVAIGITLRGRAAILENLSEFFEHVPDNFTHVEVLIEQGDWVALEWSGGGTFYADKNKTGKIFKLRGCGFFQVYDRLIKIQRGYWDKTTWSSQIE
jgi:steroid delta-isomerase-like uncharacterized protein